MFLYIITFLFSLNLQAQLNSKKAFWGQSPNESLLQPMVSTFVVNEVVDFKPLANHHFNLKANNNCQTLKPKIATEKSIQCQFDQAGKYTASLFICDDANTFCKMEKIKLEVTAPSGYKSALKKRVSSNILYVPREEISAPPGFIKNREAYAKELAQKKDLPLLIVFAAQWCPSCNMLDENVFRTKSFQDETKGVVKLIVDVDSDISWNLKERFNVGGYPTTILTTSTLNEINRFVGYRSPKGVSNWLKSSLALQEEPIEFVQSKVVQLKDTSKDSKFKEEYNKKALRLAQWYLDQNENERALSLLNDTDTELAEKLKLKARLNVVKKTDDKNKIISILKSLLDDYKKDGEYVYWMSELALLNPDIAKKYTDTMEENLKYWMESSMDDAEYTRAEIFYAAADTYESLNNKSFAQKHYLNCATEYEKLEKESLIEKPRGAPLERAFCLTKAKQNEKALELFDKLAGQYKKEFGYNYYYARALKDTGDKKKALVLAKKSLDGSYGDNFIRAATLKAQLEIELEDLKSAEKTVEAALAKIYLPETTQIRTHRYVASLKKVLEDIQLRKINEEKK